MPAISVVRVQAVASVKAADTLPFVLHGVGVDDVEDDGDAHAVGRVEELHQLLGGAEAERRREEVGNLVAERPIVRVLLDGHKLYRIVTQSFNPWQYRLLKFMIGGNLRILR